MKKLWKQSPFLVGKPTISMVMFNSYVTNYQRVWLVIKCSYTHPQK